jgi:hypothetical protein
MATPGASEDASNCAGYVANDIHSAGMGARVSTTGVLAGERATPEMLIASQRGREHPTLPPMVPRDVDVRMSDSLARHTQAMSTCLACGFDGIAIAELWDGDVASDEICPCCGLHYGYDDAGHGRGDPASEFYDGWRAKWASDGHPWFSTATHPPDGWSASEQVARLLGG